MKNLKVSSKLIVSFLIVALLTALVGVVGIWGIASINNSLDDMYQNQTRPLPDMSKSIEMLQRIRACMREFIVGAATGDEELIDDANERVQNYLAVMAEHMDGYKVTIADPEALRLFEEAELLFETSFMECLNQMYEMANAGEDPHDLYEFMREYTPDVNKIVDNLDICMQMKIDVAADANDSATATSRMMTVLNVGVLVTALVIAVFFALYISNLISKPLMPLTAFMLKAGSTGDLTLDPSDVELISKMSQVKDEIGQTISSASTFVQRVTDVSMKLTAIAEGDLTPEIELLSDKDTMGLALKNMLENLNMMFSEINSASTQVSTGSKQVSDGAQSLAQGSTEQAASVEQLSSSVSQIAEQTKVNTDRAGKAAALAERIKSNAEKSSHQMDGMIEAVKEINDASQSIGKVISVIDNIAFQTNILALNAAVEAARAGQHGKGFAVVAEEVRSLASKSAAAARETGAMIENSISKAVTGVEIASATAESLAEIVNEINESAALVEEISKSSHEQSSAIEQINTGINQVAQVIQQNSATAQQSAAASQEMSGQSDLLQQFISQFKLKDAAGWSATEHRPPKKQLIMPKKDEYAYADGADFGKY